MNSKLFKFIFGILLVIIGSASLTVYAGAATGGLLRFTMSELTSFACCVYVMVKGIWYLYELVN